LNTYSYVLSNPVSLTDETGLLPGECLAAEAAQYWADLHVKTGNPIYAFPGALASLWTPENSEITASVLFWGYGIREAGATWLMRDGVSKGYTFLNIPSLVRLERHPFGRGSERQNAWHSNLLGGREHRSASAGIAVAGVLGASNAAGVEISQGDRCGCNK
jgi:hypothetical protein